MSENWMPLYINDIYEVSNLGNARRASTQRPIKLSRTTKGYMKFGAWRDGKNKNIEIHRAVYFSFNPDDDTNMQVDHIDGDKTNNNLKNLRTLSPRENTMAHHGISDMTWIRKTRNNTYQVQLYVDGIKRSFGTYDLETAKELRDLLMIEFLPQK